MAEYVVVFRLPLRTGSRIAEGLEQCGWRHAGGSIYYRNVEMNYEDVVDHIKDVCQSLPDLGPGSRLGAFSVLPIRRPNRAVQPPVLRQIA